MKLLVKSVTSDLLSPARVSGSTTNGISAASASKRRLDARSDDHSLTRQLNIHRRPPPDGLELGWISSKNQTARLRKTKAGRRPTVAGEPERAPSPMHQLVNIPARAAASQAF